ncbi:MAG: hypothetical protein ACXWN0_01145 [Isosphaeraceae bacterium]
MGLFPLAAEGGCPARHNCSTDFWSASAVITVDFPTRAGTLQTKVDQESGTHCHGSLCAGIEPPRASTVHHQMLNPNPIPSNDRNRTGQAPLAGRYYV